MTNELAIKADGLGKRYLLGGAGKNHDSVRDLLVDTVSSVFRRRDPATNSASEFWALNDASFEIRTGENVGIIGLNGAGKSTLLKILSRITEPTRGRARINGRVGALLEVGTGFHPDLTGRENVFLYGAILGMSRQEITEKFEAIVDFSEIRPFIDTPVKRFSSGMYVRLAFAVAAHLEPEILLLDEVLAVGDITFQRKCIDFAKRLQKKNATILFVSHNMFTIKTMCTRVIYLKKGKVHFDGPTDEGIKRFEEDCRLATVPWVKNAKDLPIVVKGVELVDQAGREKAVFEHGERMTVRIQYEALRPVKTPNFIVVFSRSDEVACCNYTSESDKFVIDEVSGKGVIEVQTPPLSLVADTYNISILVREKGFGELLCAQLGGSFHIRHPLFDQNFACSTEQAQWRRIDADVAAAPSDRNAGEPYLVVADERR